MLDQKYDGEIGPEDLENFLLNHIKVKPEEITKAKIHRLFKLRTSKWMHLILLTRAI